MTFPSDSSKATSLNDQTPSSPLLDSSIFQSADAVLKTRKGYFRIDTGSKALNRLLGGGIEQGAITEFFGEYRTGKTQICLQLLVMSVLPKEFGGNGGKAIYIDTEGSFRPERIIQICEHYGADPEMVLNRIYVGKAHNTQKQMELVSAIHQSGDSKIILVIVDSLTANFRAEFLGKEQLMERQQLLNRHINDLNQLASFAPKFPRAVVVTNQVMANVSELFADQKQVAVGGNIVAHGTTHRIFLSRQPSGSIRVQLIDSPYLPEETSFFRITSGGIADDHEQAASDFSEFTKKMSEGLP